MATQSVKIPVELEIKALGNSINTLEKALEKVKPGTKIYDNLNQQLTKAKRDFVSLQVASEKSFSKIGEINTFEKNFNKVSDEVQILARSLASLDFDALSFDEADLKGIRELEEKIANTRKELSGIKTNAFKELFANTTEIQETFKELNLNINTTDAEKSINKIGEATNKLRKEIASLDSSTTVKTEQKTKLDSDISELKNFKKTITQLEDPRFFRKDKSFKNKKAFVDWGKSLGLDEESIQKLVASGAKKMAAAYDQIEKEVKNKISSKTRASNSAEVQIKKNTVEKEAKQASLNKYEKSLTQIQDIEVNPGVISKIQTLEKELFESREELVRLKEELRKLKGPETGDISKGLKGIPQEAEAARQAVEKLNAQQQKLNNMQNAIKQWFGFNEVINLTKRTVNNAVDHIRELDKVMTEIAVVTDMTQDDLWAQIDTYSQIASEYGVATEGVYKVSQLYYQQGLDTAEVMELTTETLKMAKIAGLDYTDATDYMTVAIRGFKLEMSDAGNVVDVYSRIAAVTASDTEELAVAMSKTASSAEAVGSSFENTTAMIALMVETTRESAQNIGSALKSIISRYGEMTSDPSKMVDSEGEEMSLNRVDKALQSIGISLQDASGQFRDFDDVILELSSKWETLDKNSQRYLKVA